MLFSPPHYQCMHVERIWARNKNYIINQLTLKWSSLKKKKEGNSNIRQNQQQHRWRNKRYTAIDVHLSVQNGTNTEKKRQAKKQRSRTETLKCYVYMWFFRMYWICVYVCIGFFIFLLALISTIYYIFRDARYSPCQADALFPNYSCSIT